MDEAEEAKAREDYQPPPEVAQEVAALYSEEARASAAAVQPPAPPTEEYEASFEEFQRSYPFPGRFGHKPWTLHGFLLVSV